MSKVISVLNQARFHGIADVTELGVQGMISLRGDLSSARLKTAARTATGATVPEPHRVTISDQGGLCWMAPDELLVLVPYAEVSTRLTKLQDALAKDHALAVDVSDARAVFQLGGPHAREVLAKLSPVDLSARAFTPGMLRRTRLAQVAAAFWMTQDEAFRIVCFRSVAQYVFDLLSIAAQDGSEVDAL
ncbi:sarcosine oxidase subunit gamma family protein [Aestuariivita sp.]|jgi:sarcosine oxidase subunit gamma|uniref:sarcosine oxidase subunit gamma n=1 Tax=Aestuariivita sp. TaxID=1872407 RepID=UPI002172FAD7|nr:sarcosine oxidase subunit gamma family protein [Aestuariivita sp.]MCE8009600.1 sarcosine oxidase subunit gamma [Aestuariivita sp.]